MGARAVRVWDPFVRIVHWTVAALVVTDLLNEAGANAWHRYFGYAAGALVIVRLAWGLIAPAHARLSEMARSASRALPYAQSLTAAGLRSSYLGHNPLGACMAFTLWTLTLIVVVTGWMLRLDRFWGDEFMEQVHGYVAYVLCACAVVHVGSVLAMSALYRTNLAKAMITGNKRAPEVRQR